MPHRANKAEVNWTELFSEALNVPGALGNTYNRFYNYSFLNQLLVFSQTRKLEPIATYNRWLELGRQVRKGSKAKGVLAPVVVKRDRKDSNGVVVMVDGKPAKDQALVGFRWSNTVFTLSDTDGDALPETEVPGWNADTALAALNVTAESFAMLDGNIAGYSWQDDTGAHLALNPVAKYPAKTRLHELAHIVLGHCAETHDTGGHAEHRGVIEFEAEATAYLVAKELELTAWDAAESRAYIQTWLDRAGARNHETGELDDFDRHVRRVFTAAQKILAAGRPVQQTLEAAA